MPKDSQIVGAARRLSIKTFNDLVEHSIKNFIEINYHQEDLKNFTASYVQIDATGTNGWKN